ncbi:MAG: Gfo/Idh/MocA family oxidoreductase [Ignisphaera sp.]|nr:Gfo/Idh/MocA family oxidoreductase [Ignisphaera sp.]MCX8167848.1 Gfo/Idh/MocA family oxidoreductase [Ignisphaera sp.]MDW8086122.1 Gfo/Idh/MocA family oxidoreductase [Ignisphaera sp.]
MNGIRCVVVGLGRIGRIHAENLKYRVEGAELAAVVDIAEGIAKSVGESLRIRWYTDYLRALEVEKPDAIIIATPTHLHKENIISAVKYGVNVFVEKPLAPNLSDAMEIYNIVKSKSVLFQIGFQRRFDPVYRRAKSFIDSGGIGNPVAFIAVVRDPEPPPSWARDPRISGGMFADQLSHDFDIARYLLNDEISEVYVVGDSYMYDDMKSLGDPDAAAILFRTRRGLHGTIHATRRFPYGYELRNEVYGSEGVVYIGTNRDENIAYGTKQGLVYLGAPFFEKRWSDAYLEELRIFVHSVQNGREPPVTVVDGVRAAQIADACWRSYREKRPVSIPTS